MSPIILIYAFGTLVSSNFFDLNSCLANGYQNRVSFFSESNHYVYERTYM